MDIVLKSSINNISSRGWERLYMHKEEVIKYYKALCKEYDGELECVLCGSNGGGFIIDMDHIEDARRHILYEFNKVSEEKNNMRAAIDSINELMDKK